MPLYSLRNLSLSRASCFCHSIDSTLKVSKSSSLNNALGEFSFQPSQKVQDAGCIFSYEGFMAFSSRFCVCICMVLVPWNMFRPLAGLFSLHCAKTGVKNHWIPAHCAKSISVPSQTQQVASTPLCLEGCYWCHWLGRDFIY